MKYARRMLIFFIAFTAFGVVALILALTLGLPEGYRDGVASGITGGFLITGSIGIVTSLLLMRRPGKAAEIELVKTEERTEFIRMRTHSAVFTVMIYLISAAAIAALLCGQMPIALVLAGLQLLQAGLYVGFARHFAKKY